MQRPFYVLLRRVQSFSPQSTRSFTEFFSFLLCGMEGTEFFTIEGTGFHKVFFTLYYGVHRVLQR